MIASLESDLFMGFAPIFGITFGLILIVCVPMYISQKRANDRFHANIDELLDAGEYTEAAWLYEERVTQQYKAAANATKVVTALIAADKVNSGETDMIDMAQVAVMAKASKTAHDRHKNLAPIEERAAHRADYWRRQEETARRQAALAQELSELEDLEAQLESRIAEVEANHDTTPCSYCDKTLRFPIDARVIRCPACKTEQHLNTV